MMIKEIKHMLQEHGERCLDLANHLSEDGDPLSSDESALIRTALYPAIDEATNIIKQAFLMGKPDWMEREIERLHKLQDLGGIGIIQDTGGHGKKR